MTTTQSPAPGWYPDPDGPGQRYFDGTEWTEHRSGVRPVAPPPPPIVTQPGGYQPAPKKSNTWKWVVGGIVGVVIVAAAAGGSSTSTDEKDNAGSGGSAEKPSAAGKAKGNEDPEKPNNATDDHTPRVASNGKITVDGIVYSVTSVDQRKTIGDPTFGAEEQASGTYLVVNVKAHSTKGETATLSDDTFKVTYEGGPEYSADTDGTVALLLEGGESGSEPFFLTDVQPDSNEKGALVFDVPDAVLGKKLELRVNELGLGSTHGFIRLRTK